MTTTKASSETGTNTRRMSRAVLAGGSAMVLGGLSLATGATPAGADHQFGEISGYLNSREWRVCTDGTAALGPLAVNWATALYNSHPEVNVTQLGPITSPACQTAGGPDGWNLFVRYDYFPLETWDGQTGCFFTAGPGSCTIKFVVLNGSVADAATPNPLARWKQAACHEFGHVAGLGDRFDGTSCLTDAAAPPSSPVPPLIPDAHDWDAISATY